MPSSPQLPPSRRASPTHSSPGGELSVSGRVESAFLSNVDSAHFSQLHSVVFFLLYCLLLFLFFCSSSVSFLLLRNSIRLPRSIYICLYSRFYIARPDGQLQAVWPVIPPHSPAIMWKASERLMETISHYASFPATGVSLRQMVQFGDRPSTGRLFLFFIFIFIRKN